MIFSFITDLPTDGGPIYKETMIIREFWIYEPWNAVSSLAIVIPAAYWALKLRDKPLTDFLFMWYCIPLLILGGTGSTLFHGLRSSSWLLWLDVFPTAILTLSIGVLFWIRYTKNWYFTIGLFIVSYAGRLVAYELLPGHTATNLAYFITGTLIFLPILLYLQKINWLGLKWIIYSILFLLISLTFREIDEYNLFNLSMGTHFLWHLFSGVGAYFLARFLYVVRLAELENKLQVA